jgi:hypothetical protein
VSIKEKTIEIKCKHENKTTNCTGQHRSVPASSVLFHSHIHRSYKTLHESFLPEEERGAYFAMSSATPAPANPLSSEECEVEASPRNPVSPTPRVDIDSEEEKDENRTPTNSHATGLWNNLKLAVKSTISTSGMVIRNRESILSALDDKLNSGQPPAIEYFFVEDAVNTHSVAGISPFGFGHACVRYTLKQEDGTFLQKMVNIERGVEGTKQPELIHVFESPENYIFGGTGKNAGKGGVFSRNIASLRIEKATEAQVHTELWQFCCQTCLVFERSRK